MKVETVVQLGSIAVAALGLVTTMLAPILSGRLAHRQAQATDLRALRMALFLDIGEYAEEAWRRLKALTASNEEHDRSGLTDLVHPLRLTARISLLAPRDVRDAWRDFLEAEDRLRWEWYENPDVDPEGTIYVDPADPVALRTAEALRGLQQSLRAAVINPDRRD
ncbi:hypothetical protein [Micromonospora sp. NPDC048169]|uniref:hypothetical protein n=1 Tax=Micromonospora sp. NPDC048169 TaxID=3154711 RepID=UPI0033F10193